MSDWLSILGYFFLSFQAELSASLSAIAYFLPMLLIFDIPLSIMILIGIGRWYFRYNRKKSISLSPGPTVSCAITCYNEGDDIKKTILTLCEQVYHGRIEIIAIIDGATVNKHTLHAARECMSFVKRYNNRYLIIIPKWQRGGRVSSLNAALNIAKGDLFLALDGDTSFDNDMMFNIVQEFSNSNAPAVGGALRVRNEKINIITKMQAIEYMLSLQSAKTGLAEWNVINNVSGAFGAFRTKFLRQIGGWDTHSAEDLDLTLRIKQYMSRHPEFAIPFSTRAIGHTDVPSTIKGLFMQRIRWDGDLYFLYMRKHKKGLSPKLLGWKNYLFTVVYGVIQNILLPYLAIIFNVYLFFNYPSGVVFAGFLIQYLCYLSFALIHFTTFILAISERPKKDAYYIRFLILYPMYSFLMRIVNSIAVLNEIFRRGHEESGMAPWWVLKRGGKF